MAFRHKGFFYGDAMTTHDLKRRYQSFKRDNPGVRIRDAAKSLGVSELELLATGLGDNVTRLNPDWYTFLPELSGVGPLLALTRNDAAVIEKTGCYTDVRFDGAFVRINGEQVDLAFLLTEWVYAFAVEDQHSESIRRSIHVFDAYGTAVHKIYTRNAAGADRLLTAIGLIVADDQTPPLLQGSRASSSGNLPRTPEQAETISLLTRFNGSHAPVEGPSTQRSLTADCIRTMLEMVVAQGLSIRLTVASPGTVQVHKGPVYRLKPTPPWFNILDPEFNLHLREDLVAEVQVGEIPGDGTPTLELYDRTGRLIAVFGIDRPEDDESLRRWSLILSHLC
jgi:putative hemin transport protein